jgi:DhnA family fructose-bisphosphate aldolase class Ia
VTKRSSILVAFDHAPLGLVPGLERISDKVRALLPLGLDGVILNFGVLKHLSQDILNGPTPAIARLDGNQTYLQGDWLQASDWELFYSADAAARLGASGAIVNLLIGGPAELASMRVVAQAATACADLGIPLYVSAIAVDEPNTTEASPDIRRAFAARMAFELGADIVNLYGAGDPTLVEHVRTWCDAPLIAQGAPAGGSLSDVSNWAEKCRSAWADGICVGRAVWQSSDPSALVAQLLNVMRADQAEAKGVEQISRGLD